MGTQKGYECTCSWSPCQHTAIEKRQSDFDRVTAERDGLQISLNTADQSIDELNAAISRRTQRVRELETALAGMLFAFDDGVGREWSEDLLDFARKLTAAKEFKAALKPAEGGGDES